MMTECNQEQMEFHGLGRRRVVGSFDGGRITYDGGALLLRPVLPALRPLRTGAVCVFAAINAFRREKEALFRAHWIQQRLVMVRLQPQHHIRQHLPQFFFLRFRNDGDARHAF